LGGGNQMGQRVSFLPIEIKGGVIFWEASSANGWSSLTVLEGGEDQEGLKGMGAIR